MKGLPSDILRLSRYKERIKRMSEQITCKNFDFFITWKCTMNCKLCTSHVPYIPKPFHTPKETVFREIREFFRIWDYADRIELIGGEPLLHPDLLEIVKESLRYRRQFGRIRISTNATIVPSVELLSFMRDSDVHIEFFLSDYGPYSRKLSEIVEKCEQYVIPYEVRTYYGDAQYADGWVDLGDCETYRGYTEEDWRDVFRRCVVPKNNWVMVNNGKAFFCTHAMAAYQITAGALPEDGGYIDLFADDIPLERKRELAKNPWQSPSSACRYCNGYDPENSKRYPAAEQMPRHMV